MIYLVMLEVLTHATITNVPNPTYIIYHYVAHSVDDSSERLSRSLNEQSLNRVRQLG
jgi:hypothetical protein